MTLPLIPFGSTGHDSSRIKVTGVKAAHRLANPSLKLSHNLGCELPIAVSKTKESVPLSPGPQQAGGDAGRPRGGFDNQCARTAERIEDWLARLPASQPEDAGG